MNTTNKLPPSDTQQNTKRVFRVSDTTNAANLLVGKLMNGGAMSNILQSFYPEEVASVMKEIKGGSGALNPVERRFLLKNSDSSIKLSQEELRHKKLIFVIDYLLYGDGDVREVFRDLLYISNHQIIETIQAYYPDYANVLDVEKLIAGIRSIRNGQQTRESFLKQIH